MQLIDALKITIDLARGLNWLHRFGWIHRDLKPSNLGICRAGPGEQTGMLKIMDLGLARRVPVPTEEGAPPRKRTDKYLMTGETGSLRYMAPEVMSNEPYNHLVDMYSMGVILFELMVHNHSISSQAHFSGVPFPVCSSWPSLVPLFLLPCPCSNPSFPPFPLSVSFHSFSSLSLSLSPLLQPTSIPLCLLFPHLGIKQTCTTSVTCSHFPSLQGHKANDNMRVTLRDSNVA